MVRPLLLNVAALINRRSKALRNISRLCSDPERREPSVILGYLVVNFPRPPVRIRRHL